MQNDVLSQIGAALLAIWSAPGVQVIVYGVLLNVALAIAAALRAGEFSFQTLGDFLFKQLLPYVIVYYAFLLAGEATGFGWVSAAVWSLIMAAIAARIVENLAALGVPIPERLVRLAAKPGTLVRLRKIDVGGSQPAH